MFILRAPTESPSGPLQNLQNSPLRRQIRTQREHRAEFTLHKLRGSISRPFLGPRSSSSSERLKP
eukprot:8573434-Alexandrium_andersonii.AAC.1